MSPGAERAGACASMRVSSGEGWRSQVRRGDSPMKRLGRRRTGRDGCLIREGCGQRQRRAIAARGKALCQAGPAVLILRKVAAAGHVGLGVMRHGLNGMRLVLAAALMGGSRLAEREEEKEHQRQHQPQDLQRTGPAITYYGNTRTSLPGPAGAERMGRVSDVPHRLHILLMGIATPRGQAPLLSLPSGVKKTSAWISPAGTLRAPRTAIAASTMAGGPAT